MYNRELFSAPMVIQSWNLNVATFFLGGSSLPGLSREGWRERNSVMRVGKAAASSLMRFASKNETQMEEMCCY